MQLSFKVLPNEFSRDHQVRILFYEQDILEQIDKTSLGLDPVEFFAQPELHATGDLRIGRCACGCVGCDDVWAKVSRTEQEVLWDLSSRGMQFTFSLPDYDEAMRIGASDLSWETLDRTAERLVSKLDYTEFAKQGLAFQWASARCEESQMMISFKKDGRQQLYKAAWDHKVPEQAVENVRHLLKELLEKLNAKS